MKTIIRILVPLTGISLLMVGLSYAQPNIPKEKIPSDIPSEVRMEIEKLYSKDPKVREEGAKNLGEMGAKGKGVESIPFLKASLTDGNKDVQYKVVEELKKMTEYSASVLEVNKRVDKNYLQVTGKLWVRLAGNLSGFQTLSHQNAL